MTGFYHAPWPASRATRLPVHVYTVSNSGFAARKLIVARLGIAPERGLRPQSHSLFAFERRLRPCDLTACWRVRVWTRPRDLTVCSRARERAPSRAISCGVGGLRARPARGLSRSVGVFERGLCPRNPVLGKVSEGAAEAPSEFTRPSHSWRDSEADRRRSRAGQRRDRRGAGAAPPSRAAPGGRRTAARG
jgi:hypothetical protein